MTTRQRVYAVILAIVIALAIAVDDTGPCFEDEPCWDCHTMGNMVCGPSEGGTP